MPFIAGDIAVKRYRIVSRLGSGDFGAVYRAWDTKSQRHVAIKEYLDPHADTQRRFREEARALARLKHPQLPEVIDHFGIDLVGQYLVFTFVDGPNLADLIEQGYPLPSSRIIDWMQKVTEPLAYLHSKERLHLDIKPENIRITPQGKVFLVDSGLAGLGHSKGTAGYASLEQQNQRPVKESADIYSLGATLYKCLCNQDPPTAANREVGLDDLKPARDINPNIEPYLSMVAGRAMSLRPDTRYLTVQDFASALQRPVGSPEPLPRETTRTVSKNVPLRADFGRKPRRQMETRTLYALSGILVLMIALGALFGLVDFGGDEADPEPVEATATFESQIAIALTEVAPAPSPTFDPTNAPTPTPEPFVHPETNARMIYIPEGTFRMGNSDGEDDEQPTHIVRLDAYFIDESEVTNAQFSQCVEAGACDPPQSPNATFHPSYYGDPLYDDYPVIFVNWYQADDFCDWRGGRLPSEAEWEYAGGYREEVGELLTFPWGEIMTEGTANFCDSTCTLAERNVQFDDGHLDTAPIRTFPLGRSSFGLFDMSGNVMEWVADWYDAGYYEVSADTNPLGPPTGVAKSLRGGSWLSTVDGLHVTGRGSFVPEVARANLGFRCAMTPD